MDEYTPTDEDMRRRHSLGVDSEGNKRVFMKYQNEWDAWLAEHDARVRRDAAQEVIDKITEGFGDVDYVLWWFNNTYPEVTE